MECVSSEEFQRRRKGLMVVWVKPSQAQQIVVIDANRKQRLEE
jgi:hypothetical protein